MATDRAMKRLFAEYEKSFDGLNFKRQAHCFGDVFMLAGPRGVIAERKPKFLKNANRAAAYYRSWGHTSARLISLEAPPISKEFSIVKIHWGVTFRKPGHRPIEFDLSYLVQENGGEARIVADAFSLWRKELGLLDGRVPIFRRRGPLRGPRPLSAAWLAEVTAARPHAPQAQPGVARQQPQLAAQRHRLTQIGQIRRELRQPPPTPSQQRCQTVSSKSPNPAPFKS